MCERRRLRPEEGVSVDAILAVCRVIKTPPMDLEEAGLTLLFRLARAAPDIFVPILSELLCEAIYLCESPKASLSLSAAASRLSKVRPRSTQAILTDSTAPHLKNPTGNRIRTEN